MMQDLFHVNDFSIQLVSLWTWNLS